MSVIISLLIILLVAVIAFYIIDAMGIPYPINWVVKLIVGIVALISVLKYLPGVNLNF